MDERWVNGKPVRKYLADLRKSPNSKNEVDPDGIMKYLEMLWIQITNNGIERFLRKIRRNVRKRFGNVSTGNVLVQTGETLALFQNMENAEYRKVVFGMKDIGSVFGKYRKPFRKNGFTKKKNMALVKKVDGNVIEQFG